MINNIQASYKILKDSSAHPSTASSTVISKLLFSSVEAFCTIFHAASVTIIKEEKIFCVVAILKFLNTSSLIKE